MTTAPRPPAANGKPENEMSDDGLWYRDEDDDYADPEANPRCSVCAGDGWAECDDPIQCTYEHDEYGEHRCPSCGGSGRAEDMTIW